MRFVYCALLLFMSGQAMFIWSSKTVYAQEDSLSGNDALVATSTDPAAPVGPPITSAGDESVNESVEEAPVAKQINLNYFAILYGPSVQNPTSYQPSADGAPDPD